MNAKVRSVVNFLDANLHRQIKMTEITALVGLSYSRVHDLFKAELDQSPMQYHKCLRLEKARTLLEDSVMTIKQVGLEVGYQDQRHFFREFKKHFGQTPSQYRACQAATTLIARKPPERKQWNEPLNSSFGHLFLLVLTKPEAYSCWQNAGSGLQ